MGEAVTWCVCFFVSEEIWLLLGPSDLRNDGQLSDYERQPDDAIQNAVQNGDELEDKPGIYHCGMSCGISSGIMAKPISDNPVPPGSGASNVRDYI